MAQDSLQPQNYVYSNIIRRFLPLFLALGICIGATQPAWAQVGASLSGIVQDPSKAAVPAAAVTIKNVGTGALRNTTTDAAGRYQVALLPVGEYEIRIAKNGFAETTRSGVRLVVNQDAVVDFALSLSSASQQVTVVADAPPVSLSTSDTSGLVGEEQIRNLPLNGRSFDNLLTLNPGVVNFTSEKTGGIGVSNSTMGNNFAVSGNRPQQNLFLLNGVEFTGAAENNMQPGGTSQQLLGVDAVQEFNILRDSYAAEYGKKPGAQVLIVTRGGTNQFHGSAYDFLRNSAMDARNFFDGNSVPGFQRNQFGAAVGGPLQKDKTFFFANVEDMQQHLHQTGVDLVPDNNMRNGYLPCSLITPAPNPCPASGIQFVGVSPLINLWPVASPGAPDFGGIAETFNTPLQTIRDTFATLRMDHIISSKDTLNAVYTIDDSGDVTPTNSNSYASDIDTLREQVLTLNETHIISPSLLNDARVGFSRAGFFFTGEPTPGTPAASLSGFLQGLPVGVAVVGGAASSNAAASLSSNGSNNGSNLHMARNLFTYEDRISLTKGIHQFSAGVWFQRVQANEEFALSQRGQAAFTSLLTFLQGTVATFTFDPAPTPLGWRTTLGALYADDSIRLAKNLKLTVGFRDEFTTGWNEAHGRASNYTFTNGVISNTPQVGSSDLTTNNAKFLPQPRLGLAWSPVDSNKTVLRAGFGMYNDLQDALGYRTDQNAPFNPTYSLSNEPVASLPINPLAIPAASKLAPGGIQPDLKTPTLVSYSLRLQQQLGKDTTLSVGYVGSHGYHEIIGVNANEPFPVICPASPCPATYPSSFPAGLAGQPVPAGSYYVPTATRANASLVGTWTYFSLGDSSYNAMQIDLNHRFSGGLVLRGVYTWSKTLDDGDSLNPTTSGSEPAVVANPFDIRADKGLANFDVRNAAAISASYALPFGPGKQFLQNASGFGKTVVAGWTLNTIITMQGGFPFTPQLSYNPSNNGDGKDPVRPFVNPFFTGPVITGNPNGWFNTSAFLAYPNASGFYGNLGRDTLIGPGLATWDMSVHKDFRIRERLALQFRAEAFNLLNRANFGFPNPVAYSTSGTSPTAGVITNTSTTSRQIQLSLKLIW